MKPLRGECQRCGLPLEFPAENIGTVGTCPHCGKETELRLEIPKLEPALSQRTIFWSMVGVVVLVVALVVTMVGLNHYEKLLERRKGAAIPPAATNSSEPGSRP